MIKKNYILLAIFLLALVLRLISLNQSLWLDEAIGALVVKEFSFRDILLKFPLSDNHPPLYYLLLKAWTLVFGFKEISLRLPSVLFGVLTCITTYKLSKSFWAGLLLATSPLFIYYSQEARMYVMAAFVGTTAIYFYLKTFNKKTKVWDWILFSFFATVLIFTDYVPVFMYPLFVIYALLKKTDISWWKKFFLSLLPLLILGVSWLPIFLIQSAKGRQLLVTLPAWREVAGGATFKQLVVFWSKLVIGRISFYNKAFQYLLVIAASIPFVFSLASSFKRIKENEFYWLWFLVPTALGFLVSFWFPAFAYFRFIFVLPALFILLAKGKFVTVVLIINLIGWGIYVLDAKQHRENWREAVYDVENIAKKDEVVIFENPEPFAPYRWYATGRIEAVGVTDSISANPLKTAEITKSKVSGKTGVYYFEYLRDLQDPAGVVQTTLKEAGFAEDSKKAFNGVGFVIHYLKKDLYANRD